jgi:DNA modification methylase
MQAPIVRTYRTEELRPYEQNARKHSANQIAQLRSAIRRFGFNAPIAVWQENMILAGHGRVEAAIAEGITEVPGVDLSHLPFNEARAYCLSDNRIADMAKWDDPTLRAELTALHEAEVDLADIGFSSAELAKLVVDIDLPPEVRQRRADAGAAGFEPQGEATAPEAAAEDPLIGSPVASEGELWTMGDHVLVVGSCTDPEAVARACPDGAAKMLLTDPPYGVDYGAKNRDLKRASIAGGNETDIANDDLSLAELESFLTAAFGTAHTALQAGGAIWVFSAPGDREHAVLGALFAAKLNPRHGLIWVKDAPVLSRADMNYQHEPLFYGWKPGAAHAWHGPSNETSVWECPKPRASKAHPTMKPVALLERAIRNSSKAGELVLDIFGGSGSTMVAAHNRGRRSALVELSPAFADVILRRAIHECGLEPVREDGAGFAEVEAARLKAEAA